MLKILLVMAVAVGLPLVGYAAARRRKKWEGLMLPLVFLGLSLNSAYAMNQYLHTYPQADPLFIQQMTFLVFELSNIPTLVVVLICLIRYWKKRREQRLSEHGDLRKY